MNIEQQADVVLRRLADASTKEVVFDVETSGLDWKRNFICGWVFTFSADPRDTYYIPVRHGGGHNLGSWNLNDSPTILPNNKRQHPFEEMLRAIAVRTDLRWIGHNVKFDLHFANNPASRVPIKGLVEDTMVTQPMLNEFMRSFSLESCCEYFGVPGKKSDQLYRHLTMIHGGEPNRAQMANFWKLAGNDPIGVDYAKGDGVATWNLMQRQRKEIAADNMNTVWDVERRTTRVLYRMEHRGIRIDEERLHEVSEIIEVRLKDAQRHLPEGLNTNSGPQLEKLFRDKGITNFSMTAPSRTFPNGKPSFKEEWLVTNELGKKIVAVRKYEHLRDSFVVPLRDTHAWKGRVHTNYNQLRNDEFGTITGRLSSNDPNLQQIHKRNEELGRLFRSVFIPDDGMIFSSSDYVQIEPVLLAYYGRVQVLLDGFRANPPVDAHSAVAKAAGIDRQSGKVLNQALLTGAGRAKIAWMLKRAGVSADPDEIMRNYFISMPEIQVIQKEAANRFRARGYVLSLLGRKARLESPDKAYKALNRLLQCGNADIIKTKMCQMDEYYESEGDRVNLLNQIHDDLAHQFFEADRRVYEQGLRLMTDFDSVDQPIRIDVPLRIDTKEGRTWAEATYGPEIQPELLKDAI